jgi:hypothetical protein
VPIVFYQVNAFNRIPKVERKEATFMSFVNSSKEAGRKPFLLFFA